MFDQIAFESYDKVTPDEFLQFFYDFGINDKTMTEELVAQIMAEFDTSQKGWLEYDEFLNIFLPSTNERLRDACFRRGKLN